MQIKIVFLQFSDCFVWFKLEKELLLTTLLLDLISGIDSKQPVEMYNMIKVCSDTGNRTRACWVRASYPNP